MKNISKDIMNEIKRESIKPIPKWAFFLKSSFIWSLFIINIILGSLVTSLIIFQLGSNDIVFEPSLAGNIWNWFILGLPLLWIIFLAVFIITIIYNFRNTQRGYKYKFVTIFFASIVVTVTLGFLLNRLDLSQKINTYLHDNVSFYSSTFDLRSQVWMRPQEGYLAGVINQVNGSEIKLIDLSGKSWIVDLDSANIKPRAVLAPGEKVKIIGKIGQSNVFNAIEVRPYDGRGRNLQ